MRNHEIPGRILMHLSSGGICEGMFSFNWNREAEPSPKCLQSAPHHWPSVIIACQSDYSPTSHHNQNALTCPKIIIGPTAPHRHQNWTISSEWQIQQRPSRRIKTKLFAAHSAQIGRGATIKPFCPHWPPHHYQVIMIKSNPKRRQNVSLVFFSS